MLPNASSEIEIPTESWVSWEAAEQERRNTVILIKLISFLSACEVFSSVFCGSKHPPEPTGPPRKPYTMLLSARVKIRFNTEDHLHPLKKVEAWISRENMIYGHFP